VQFVGLYCVITLLSMCNSAFRV